MQTRPRVRTSVVVAVLVMLGVWIATTQSAFAQDRRFEFRSVERTWEKPEREGNRKVDFLFRASRGYLAVGTTVDMVSTIRVLHHPTVARREDGTFLARSYGVETGWAKAFGKRNTAAVVAANVGLNLGVDLLSRKLYRKGGRWRYVAIGLNLWKGTDSLMAGIGNIRYYNRGFDRRIQEATGYRGSVVWTSQ